MGGWTLNRSGIARDKGFVFLRLIALNPIALMTQNNDQSWENLFEIKESEPEMLILMFLFL